MIYKRVRLLVLILLAAAGLVNGEAYGQASFRYGSQALVVNNSTSSYDAYKGIAIDSSGNIYAAPCGANNYSNVCKETLLSNGTYTETILFSQAANGLNSPNYVAVDAGGNVYIADVLNSRVLKETLTGSSYTQSVVTDFHNGLTFPNQIAVDSNGNVYVTDPDNKRVLKETLSGSTYTQSIIGSGLNLPYGVAVDSVGNVYIADNGLSTLFKETLSGGSYVQSVIVNDTTFNWLNSVNNVAVDGHGNVYITDGNGPGYNSGAIVVATPTAAGYLITNLSADPQSNAADPRFVSGIAVDSQNNVYVSGFSYQITKFSYPSTNFGPVAVGNTGAAVTIPFYSPQGYGGQTAGTQVSAAAVSMGTSGEFTDTGTGTCDTNGSHIYASGETCTVVVTFSPKAPGIRKGAVEVVNGSGVVLATEYVSGIGTGPQVAFSSGPQSAVATGLVTPTGVALNGSGVVYIADPGTRGYIFVETPSGSGYTQSTLNETGNASLSSQPIPGGVAIDGAGNLYFSNSWNNNTYGNSISVVQYYNGSIYMTQPLAYPQQENGLTGPLGLAADPSGNIYVADTGNNRVVEEMYLSGVTYDVPAGYALQLVVASGLSGPQSVAADANGDVYIADTGNNRILLETPTEGGFFTQSVLFNNGLNTPAGVAVDAFGNVFISDTGNKRVLMETLSGSTYTQSVIPVTGLVSPQGIAVDASETLFIADSGTGSVLKIALGTGPSLTFASTNVGSTSSDSPKTVLFSNIGNAALTFPIPATGTNPSISASFSINSTGGMACPLLTSTSLNIATLPAATTCTLPISFTPATTGSINGTVKLTDNALNVGGSVQTINLNGTGTSPTAPVASLSATAIGFANQTVNTTSAASTITLSNTGTAALTGIAISITGANPADFAQTNTCGTTLAASANCTISITFTPALVASFTATLSVADNASSSPQTATLSGSGTAVPAPVANLSPTSLSLPSTNVNSTAAAQTLTLTNTGNATLTGITVSLAGANPADFAETTTCGTTLAASATCTISVTFAPLSAASFTAAVSVADNASGSPQSVTLSGIGTPAPAPQAVLSPSSLSFGSQNTGTTFAAQTITLSNTGTAALSVGSIAITGVSASAFSQTNTCGATLAANASCTISVAFTPQVVGAFTAAITVTDNASGSPQSASVSGTGTAPPVPQAVLTPTSLVFASQLLNTTSAAQTITLSNPGTATLAISSISLTGSSSSAYARTTTCGATLAAGANCTISVTFTPTAASTLVAAISVADNAGGSPQSVALSGTATNPATFALAASPATQAVNPGSAANFNIQISSSGGTFIDSVALSVTGLPAGFTGTFSAPSVTPGNAGATSVLTIQTASQYASIRGSLIPTAPVLVVLLLPPAWWMRRRLRPVQLPLALLLLFITCLGLSSCAGGYFGPVPQSFTLTVTGAADSIQQSTTVTLNVQ